MMRYWHKMRNELFLPIDPDSPITILEELFDYQDKKVLVIQNQKEGRVMTIVPGFVEKYKAEKEPTGSEITYVSAVPKEQQKDITLKDFLKKEASRKSHASGQKKNKKFYMPDILILIHEKEAERKALCCFF